MRIGLHVIGSGCFHSSFYSSMNFVNTVFIIDPNLSGRTTKCNSRKRLPILQNCCCSLLFSLPYHFLQSKIAFKQGNGAEQKHKQRSELLTRTSTELNHVPFFCELLYD